MNPMPSSFTLTSESQPSRRELILQGLGLPQVARVQTFAEPGIDRHKKIEGLPPLALLAPQPGQAHRRAQLEGFGLLLTRNDQRALQMRFCSRHAGRGRQQRDFAGDAMNVGLAPFLAGRIGGRYRLADAARRLIESTKLSVGLCQISRYQGA
jgi:hypothetical protein